MRGMLEIVTEFLEDHGSKGDTFPHIYNYVSKQLKPEWKIKYHGQMTIPELEAHKKAELFSMLCTLKNFVSVSRDKSSKIDRWALSKFLTFNEIQNINSYEIKIDTTFDIRRGKDSKGSK